MGNKTQISNQALNTTSTVSFGGLTITNPLTVSNGGTGLSTTTAYGLITGGTTSTGAFQNVGTGTSGQLLQSGGASALPTWTTATFPSVAGTAGTILRSNGTNWVASTATFADTYTSNNLLYSNGANTVTGLATANSAVLNTSSGGVPSLTPDPAFRSFTLTATAANPSVINASGGSQTDPLTINMTGASTNLLRKALVINTALTGTNATARGLQVNLDDIGPFFTPIGVESNVNIQGVAGASALEFYSGYFKLTTGTGVTTATNKSYYGLRSSCVYSQSGGTVTTYGLHTAASGGTTNYGIYSAAGLNFFVGNIQTQGSLTTSQTKGIIGTTTNNNANAGSVGEYIESAVTTPTVGLTTGTAQTITSISLTAGDWNVWGNIAYQTTATTNITGIASGISSSNNTLPSAYLYNQQRFGSAGLVPGVGSTMALPPMRRFSLSSTTTIYLVGFAQFTVDTVTAYGFIAARRIR